MSGAVLHCGGFNGLILSCITHAGAIVCEVCEAVIVLFFAPDKGLLGKLPGLRPLPICQR